MPKDTKTKEDLKAVRDLKISKQDRILNIIKRFGPMNPSQMARIIGGSSAMSRDNANALVKAGRLKKHKEGSFYVYSFVKNR